MILPLRKRALRILLVIAAFLVAFGLAYYSVRNALAARAASLGTLAGYERAVRLEPGSARNWYLLGHYL